MAETASTGNSSLEAASDECKYNLDYPEKGLCLIINMENFSSALRLEQRKGTSEDEKSIADVFKKIGFRVQIEKDKTCTKIMSILGKVAEDNHSNIGCFVCFIMSHGEKGIFYGFDDFIKEEDLFALFEGENSPHLIGKPKIFFLQKCNGKKIDLGVTLHGATEANAKVNMIPTEADFLYHYATTSGYVSWRNKKGSWFVQSLCKVLEQYWDKKELLHILTLVNRKVAIEFKSQPDAFKQLPCFVSTLTNLLYFY